VRKLSPFTLLETSLRMVAGDRWWDFRAGGKNKGKEAPP
jgi:hypothetical protein